MFDRIWASDRNACIGIGLPNGCYLPDPYALSNGSLSIRNHKTFECNDLGVCVFVLVVEACRELVTKITPLQVVAVC
jgi:hypothetical protein